MHLTLFAVGSRGDIQPFVALGLGLQRQGYTVRIGTHQLFEPMIREAGLDFAPLEGNPQAIIQNDEGRAWLESDRNPLHFASGFRKLMGPVIRQAIQDALTASEGTDAIAVTGPAYYIGHSVAEKRNVPLLQAYVQPIHPTGEFPSALFPMAFIDNSLFNYFTHMAGGQLFWQLLRPVVNEARRDFLNLPPEAWAGSFVGDMRRKLPVVYGYSPAVLPKPKNWADWLHITGYWFLDESAWTPPAALVDFLEAGPPPVYIGFGSMADRNMARMTEISLAALKQSNQRGLLLTGWGGITQSDLPDSVFKIDSAPHSWLFPRMAAVVHHGGAGTTAAGLRAGKPTVIIPFFGDQPFWAHRVARIGAGPKPISRKNLSAEQLAQAIQTAVADPAIQAKAAALGECIRAENGVQNAATVIDRYLTSLRH
ncbi:MAG: glycosyltransferase family 1 protein [Anaerolineae bacterium]|nr:glycosyltransferase family 1 protein [Anaerolineae bacterium]